MWFARELMAAIYPEREDPVWMNEWLDWMNAFQSRHDDDEADEMNCLSLKILMNCLSLNFPGSCRQTRLSTVSRGCSLTLAWMPSREPSTTCPSPLHFTGSLTCRLGSTLCRGDFNNKWFDPGNGFLSIYKSISLGAVNQLLWRKKSDFPAINCIFFVWSILYFQAEKRIYFQTLAMWLWPTFA